MSDINKELLIEEAWKARERAYVPYSGFKVGAAVLGVDGKIYRGANIENVSYGATVCAERTAIFGMVNAGCLKFKALAFVTAATEQGAPCCICRQVLTEFCESLDVPVYGAGTDTEIWEMTLREIAPYPFMAFDPDAD